jgi:hypothetical protein
VGYEHRADHLRHHSARRPRAHAQPRAGIRPTILLLLLGLGCAVGLTLVSLVPGSQANVDNGSIVLHLVGAQQAGMALCGRSGGRSRQAVPVGGEDQGLRTRG